MGPDEASPTLLLPTVAAERPTPTASGYESCSTRASSAFGGGSASNLFLTAFCSPAPPAVVLLQGRSAPKDGEASPTLLRAAAARDGQRRSLLSAMRGASRTWSLLKKGAGRGVLGRRNWTRRHFVLMQAQHSHEQAHTYLPHIRLYNDASPRPTRCVRLRPRIVYARSDGYATGDRSAPPGLAINTNSN